MALPAGSGADLRSAGADCRRGVGPPARAAVLLWHGESDHGCCPAAGHIGGGAGGHRPWTGSATTTVDSQGRYGYNPVLQVVGDDPGTPEIEGPQTGNQIALFVGGIRASLYNPATDATTLSYPYTSGESTRLDLRESYAIRLPLVMNSVVGDGVGE